MKKVILLIMAFVTTLVVASAVTASSSSLTPEQVKALFLNGETHATTGQGTVTYTAPSWVPAGAPVTTTQSKNVSGPDAIQTVCWTLNDWMWTQYGTYPYQQRVTENRYWCAGSVGGIQNYRVSHVFLHSTLCDTSGAYGYLVGGGNGWRFATVRSGGHFRCPTPIPYVNLNSDVWQEWACNTWGSCAFQRSHRDT